MSEMHNLKKGIGKRKKYIIYSFVQSCLTNSFARLFITLKLLNNSSRLLILDISRDLWPSWQFDPVVNILVAIIRIGPSINLVARILDS
jgi:hypothetical protein